MTMFKKIAQSPETLAKAINYWFGRHKPGDYYFDKSEKLILDWLNEPESEESENERENKDNMRD